MEYNTKDPRPFVIGTFFPEDIVLSVSKSNLVIPNTIKEKIESLWQQNLKSAESNGQTMYNGNSYRLNKWTFDGATLTLDLSIFDYKHRHSLIECLKRGELGDTLTHQGGCFVGATVKTADEHYVVAKLSGKSMNKNSYELLGGIVDTTVPMSTDGSFLFNMLYEELIEEGDIKPEEIEQCYIRMFYRGLYAHAGFYFEVITQATSAELAERALTNKDTDIQSLCFMTRDEYTSFLQSQSKNKKLIAKHLSI